MNREIKFRAFSAECVDENDKLIFEMIDSDSLAISNFSLLKDQLKDSVNFKLMQFTGLKDKNGITYCQDDIVKYKDKNYHLILGSYKFELLDWCQPGQDIPCDFFSEGAYKNAEIIGNIYENPELLKK